MDMKAILAFVLLIAIVLLLPKYWDIISGGKQTPSEPTVADTSTVAAPATTATTPPPAPATSGDTTSTAVASIPDSAVSSTFVADSLWSEQRIPIKTDLFEGALTTRGALIKWLVLTDYHYNDTARKGEPLVMIDSTEDAGPRLQGPDGPSILTTAPFEANRNAIQVSGADSATVTFTAHTQTGGTITVAYTFYGDRHDFGMAFSIPDPSSEGLQREYLFGWQGGLNPTEPDPGDDNGHFAAAALMGEDVEKITSVDKEEPRKSFSGVTYWAGVRSKYFLCVTIPRTREADGFIVTSRERPIRYDDERLALKTFSAYLRQDLSPGAPINARYSVYVGPLEYSELKSYGLQLEDLVDLGWRWVVRPFALMILWLFKHMHAFVPNYGLVIIIFAFLIKVVFHPLTKKSMRSMRRMQLLQPRMEKLRERFKENPQKLNSEMMKMYKEAGINPMSGCLPLLPQMPIFYGLFQVFRTTIELRGAEFFWWITDLSQKDPYYILPIIMTVSFFLQQRLSTRDPKQKMLTYVLPLVFGFMFRNFAAGLTLYWTMYNVFSVIEQAWLIGHPESLEDTEEPLSVETVSKGGKRSKKQG